MLIRALIAMLVVGLFASTDWFHVVPSAQTPTALVSAGVPQDPLAVGYLNLHKRHPDSAEGVVEADATKRFPDFWDRELPTD